MTPPVHTNSSNCPTCRPVDRAKRSEARVWHAIQEFNANQDALVHCKHPQTKTILMQRYVENEHGVALEQPEDVEQCLGCGRVLLERAV